MKCLCLLALFALSSACGGGETKPAPPQPLPACEEHELALPDGGCIRPGVPPDGCGEGFVHDGVYGCEPILPAEPCPPGLMAVPGDQTCRAIMECGQGKWGDLPVDDTTQYVDSTYTGGDSDGSEGKPWPTIGQAVADATPNALIAVAAGSYSENVVIGGKPVRLWGVCPEQVAIEATFPATDPCPLAAVCIADGADGTEVGGLALRGAGVGLTLSGSEDVLVDRVRLHDNAEFGIDAESWLGPTAIDLRGSLIEQNHGAGIYLSDAKATVDASVVRTTLPQPSDQGQGDGMIIQLSCVNTPTGVQCDPATRSSASVTRSLIEQNHSHGLEVSGSDVTVDSSVVRATLPCAADQQLGLGIYLQPWCFDTPTGTQCDPGTRSSASVTRSLIEQNHDVGLFVMGSDATVDASVVRATQPNAAVQRGGTGIQIQLACFESSTIAPCDTATRSSASVTHSLIDQNHTAGLFVAGSDATMDTTVVRATWPNADGLYGDGIGVLSPGGSASTAITNTLIADSARVGVGSFGGFVLLADSHIRCAAIALNGELFQDTDYEVEDLGGNSCGCPIADGPCKLVSAGLEPPDILPPSE